MSHQLSEEDHIRQAEALLAEIELLHARIEHLEGVWDELKKAGKKAYSGAAKAVHKTTDYARRTVEKHSKDKDLSPESIKSILSHLMAEHIKEEQAGETTRWTFDLRDPHNTFKTKKYTLTKDDSQSFVRFNNTKYYNALSLYNAINALAFKKEKEMSTDIAEIRGYTASILRQQAMLLEDF